MKRLLLALICFASLRAVAPAAAPKEVFATLVFANRGGQTRVRVFGRRGDILNARPAGADSGSADFRIQDIERVIFELPEGVDRISAAARAGNLDASSRALRGIVTPYLSYLDLPGNNVSPVALLYANVLRLSGRIEPAVGVYKRIHKAGVAPYDREAALWMAYCSLAQGLTGQAEELLGETAWIEYGSPLFPLQQLVRARVSLKRKDVRAALNQIAQALAFARIENEVYPECLFVSAECYEIAARQSIGTADAEMAGGEQIVRGSDLDRVWEEPFALTNYSSVAEGVLRQLTNLFSSSPWAAQAAARLAESGQVSAATGEISTQPSQ